MSALSWGTADFIARFTGRAFGFANALLGMLFVSSIMVTVWLLAAGAELTWTVSGTLLLVFAGIFLLVGGLLLFLALVRGPVTIAAPIAGSYPAIVVLIAVAMGNRPSLLQWVGTAVTLVGVVVVARGEPVKSQNVPAPAAAGAETAVVASPVTVPVAVTQMVTVEREVMISPASTAPPAMVVPPPIAAPPGTATSGLPALGRDLTTSKETRKTVWIAAAAGLSLALMINLTQEAVPVVGNLQTLWFPRLVALGTMLVYVAGASLRGRPLPRYPLRW